MCTHKRSDELIFLILPIFLNLNHIIILVRSQTSATYHYYQQQLMMNNFGYPNFHTVETLDSLQQWAKDQPPDNEYFLEMNRYPAADAWIKMTVMVNYM